MATFAKNTCPTCKGTGIHLARTETFDGIPTPFFHEEFCACEQGQFREWQDPLADLMEEEAWLLERGPAEDVRELCEVAA